MKKQKNKNLPLYLCSIVLLGTSMMILNVPQKKNNESDVESSSDNNDIVQEGLNHKNIKFRSNGDTITLSANVNSDATVQGVTFSSDRPDCVTVTRKTENSVILTRIKEFTGVVTINAKSDDPYSSFEDNCLVRCFNKLTSFDDSRSALVNQDQDINYLGSNTIYLSTLFDYTHVSIDCSTSFGEAEEAYNDGTFTNIEEQDLTSLKNQIESAFAPNIIKNFVQKNNVNCDNNNISFDIVYTTNLFTKGNSFNIDLSCEDINTSILVKKYIPVNNITINESDTIIVL